MDETKDNVPPYKQGASADRYRHLNALSICDRVWFTQKSDQVCGYCVKQWPVICQSLAKLLALAA